MPARTKRKSVSRTHVSKRARSPSVSDNDIDDMLEKSFPSDDDSAMDTRPRSSRSRPERKTAKKSRKKTGKTSTSKKKAKKKGSFQKRAKRTRVENSDHEVSRKLEETIEETTEETSRADDLIAEMEAFKPMVPTEKRPSEYTEYPYTGDPSKDFMLDEERALTRTVNNHALLTFGTSAPRHAMYHAWSRLKIDEWPSSCPLACNHCRMKFDVRPWFTFKKRMKDGTWVIANIFCSIGCSHRYTHMNDSATVDEEKANLKRVVHMMCKDWPPEKPIPKAPLVPELLECGGSITREEFRVIAGYGETPSPHEWSTELRYNGFIVAPRASCMRLVLENKANVDPTTRSSLLWIMNVGRDEMKRYLVPPPGRFEEPVEDPVLNNYIDRKVKAELKRRLTKLEKMNIGGIVTKDKKSKTKPKPIQLDEIMKELYDSDVDAVGSLDGSDVEGGGSDTGHPGHVDEDKFEDPVPSLERIVNKNTGANYKSAALTEIVTTVTHDMETVEEPVMHRLAKEVMRVHRDRNSGTIDADKESARKIREKLLAKGPSKSMNLDGILGRHSSIPIRVANL